MMTPLVMVMLTGVLVAGFELIRVELAPKDCSGDPLNEPGFKLLRALKLPAEIPVADLVMPSRVSGLQFIFDTAEVASEDLSGDFPEEPGFETFNDVKIPCRMVLVRTVSVGVIVLGPSVSINKFVASECVTIASKNVTYADISTLFASMLATGAAYADAARTTATVAVVTVVSWTILRFLLAVSVLWLCSKSGRR